MKRIFSFTLSFLFLIILSFVRPVISDEVTTLLLVRHAEKKLIGGDVPLTSKGIKRAEDLVYMLKDVDIDAVYSTPYKRTQSTASPVARDKGLEVILENPKFPEGYVKFIDDLLASYRGKTVLIVSHSNVVPLIVKIIRGQEPVVERSEYLDDNAYDNIFVAFVWQKGNARILQFKYGEYTPLK
jgi:broad specificity phosphatase PhoE